MGLADTGYIPECFDYNAGKAGTSCSGTTWSFKSHTTDECTDTGTVAMSGTAGECEVMP